MPSVPVVKMDNLVSLMWVILVSVNLYEAFSCPKKGETGVSSVPRVSSLTADQTGYRTRMEMVSGSGELLEIEEEYNGLSSVGKLRLNDGNGHRERSYWYYIDTKESFYIDSEQTCSVSALTPEVKKSIIDEWLSMNNLPDDVDVFRDPQNLGPVLLLLYLQSKGDQVQFVGPSDNKSRHTSEWFYCLNDEGPYLDVYFDSSTNYPVRLVASYPDNPSLTTTLNVITFEPLTDQLDKSVSYPYGYGCDRLIQTPDVKVPKFAEADTFNMDLEAALFFSSPDRSAVTTAEVARYQGIYSYDLKENGLTKRIVHDPKLLIDFQVDPVNGKCVEDQASPGSGYGFTYCRWPYSEGENYNLLDEAIFNLNSGKIKYMGQVWLDNKRLDVFEKKLTSFFKLGEKSSYDALITYFFPTAYDTRQPVRTQAPIKMTIKPLGELSKMASEALASRIELKVIDYHEGDFDFGNRFDISGCFEGKGDHTWFQIVFSGSQKDMLSWLVQDTQLVKSVRSIISFIPEIRIPDMKITQTESLIYASFKLLERPSYNYDFYKTPGFVIENPTRIIQRDHEQDCGEVCSESSECTNFAYCNNLECRLFSYRSTISPQIEESTECDSFGRNSLFVDPKSEVEVNFLRSSKSLIHEIKRKLTKGQLTIANPPLSAIDLFIVPGPDAIGDPDSLLTDSGMDPFTVADRYQILLTDRRLPKGESTQLGLDYTSCLTECENEDDCLAVSFCPSRKGECILAKSTEDIHEDTTVHSKGCSILSRSYLTFYRRFPGRSLIFDAQQIIQSVDLESCAKACEESSSVACESFDYCPDSGLNGPSTKVRACFLRHFHVSKDSQNLLDGKVWNLTETQCDHYAKILSKDYKQMIGYKFDSIPSKSLTVSSNDISLEACAGSCTTTADCRSFDYCETTTQSGLMTSKCRLSSLRPSRQSTRSIESTTERCSIYVSNRNDSAQSSHSKPWLFILLSTIMFTIAFIAGFVVSRHYFER